MANVWEETQAEREERAAAQGTTEQEIAQEEGATVEAVEEASPTQDLESMTKADLAAMAKEQGITITSSMTKDEIIEALS